MVKVAAETVVTDAELVRLRAVVQEELGWEVVAKEAVRRLAAAVGESEEEVKRSLAGEVLRR